MVVPSRINVRSINPEHAPPVKKDSSFLDWHYKRPTDEEMQDKYECFTENEWALHYQAEKESGGIPAKKRNDFDYVRTVVKRAACDGCTLPFQLYSRNRGLCNPVEGAVTPLDRLGQDDDE